MTRILTTILLKAWVCSAWELVVETGSGILVFEIRPIRLGLEWQSISPAGPRASRSPSDVHGRKSQLTWMPGVASLGSSAFLNLARQSNLFIGNRLGL